jgi:predicted nucleotidyltransferase
MTVQGQLRDMLETVAKALGEALRSRVVFVGGCTMPLYITDPITLEDVRTTDDVDLTFNLEDQVDWVKFEKRLHELGFVASLEDDLLCRKRIGDLKVDFMPDDQSILSFTNQWYKRGIETALTHQLTTDLQIRYLSPPLFIATKLEAHLGRGNDDPMGSHDLEDVILVIDGRVELFEEVRSADKQVRAFIASQLEALQNHRDFDSFIEGNMRRNLGRAEIVRARIAAILQTEKEMGC